jgi:hypothetical protein
VKRTLRSASELVGLEEPLVLSNKAVQAFYLGRPPRFPEGVPAVKGEKSKSG